MYVYVLSSCYFHYDPISYYFTFKIMNKFYKDSEKYKRAFIEHGMVKFRCVHYSYKTKY